MYFVLGLGFDCYSVVKRSVGRSVVYLYNLYEHIHDRLDFRCFVKQMTNNYCQFLMEARE